MDQHKVENFSQDHPGTPFPSTSQPTPEELPLLQKKIFRSARENLNIDLPKEINKLELIEKDSFPQSADSPGFKLEDAIAQFKISPDCTVYINWHRFDVIDKIKFEDLCKYFDYIWYPGSDDIEIFDNSTHWMISISHSGYTSLKFNVAESCREGHLTRTGRDSQ